MKIDSHRLILFIHLFAASEADSKWFPSEPFTFLQQILKTPPKLQPPPLPDPRPQLLVEWNRILQNTHGPWRFSSSNTKYSLSPTYSQVLPVPAVISDTVLHHAAQFRIRQRFPLLAYVTPQPSGTALLRSSQPLVGLTQRRCIQDEKLIEAYKNASQAPVSAPEHSKQSLLIVDARPSSSALANTVIGAGVERLECYAHSERIYLSLDNIHAVREAHLKVARSLKSQNWLEAEMQSGWLEQIQKILEGTRRIAQALQESHVLVHCSDGWDRTTQLVSLVQLCWDPFYRTQSGFRTLLLKDWLSAGHRFADRNYCHLQNQEACPIFLQFIEATVQLCRQYPLHFAEISDEFLLAVVDEVQAGRSSFFGNCEADRLSKLESPISVEIDGHLPLNLSKVTPLTGSVESKQADLLLPHSERAKMILWPAYYKRYETNK